MNIHATPDQKAEALFAEIAVYIKESHRLLEQGALLELNGMDEQVKVLCDEVMGLSDAQRVKYAERLQELFASLTMLEQVMRQARDAMSGDIRSISNHHHASVAYRKGETDKE